MSINRNTTLEAINLQLAQVGLDVIERTAETYTSGRWGAVYNPADSAVSISCTVNIGDRFTSFNLCSGGTIYGDFATLKCNTTGKKIVAYRIE